MARRRSIPGLVCFLALAGIAALPGCKSMTPGKMQWVQPHSEAERVGNVYLVRGFVGIWSHGIDDLARAINEAGVRAKVFQQSQSRSLADAIAASYREAAGREPLVLIGHSFGADDVVRIARRLGEENIRVDMLVTIDPVVRQKVPASVGVCHNIFMSPAVEVVPLLRGVPLEPESAEADNVRNLDVRTNRRDLHDGSTDHFNIEKKPAIHAEIVRLIRDVCPPRARAVGRGSLPRRRAAAGRRPVRARRSTPGHTPPGWRCCPTRQTPLTAIESQVHTFRPREPRSAGAQRCCRCWPTPRSARATHR